MNIKIRYDRKAVNTYGGLTLLFFVGVLIGIGSVALASGGIGLLIGIISVIGFLISVLGYIEAQLYLGRLKKFGFVVPDNKKDFDNNLYNLELDRELYESTVSKLPERNKESILNAVIHAIVGISLAAYLLMFYMKWSYLYRLEMIFFLIIPLAVALAIIARTIKYILESNEKRYRYDVVLDMARFERSVLPVSIIKTTILTLIVILIMTSASQLLNYMVSINITANYANLESINLSIEKSLIDLENEEDKKLVIDNLEQGIYLSEVDTLPETFTVKFYEYANASGYGQLASRFRMVKDEPLVFIHLDGDELKVTLENHPDLKRINYKKSDYYEYIHNMKR